MLFWPVLVSPVLFVSSATESIQGRREWEGDWGYKVEYAGGPGVMAHRQTYPGDTSIHLATGIGGQAGVVSPIYRKKEKQLFWFYFEVVKKKCVNQFLDKRLFWEKCCILFFESLNKIIAFYYFLSFKLLTKVFIIERLLSRMYSLIKSLYTPDSILQTVNHCVLTSHHWPMTRAKIIIPSDHQRSDPKLWGINDQVLIVSYR